MQAIVTCETASAQECEMESEVLSEYWRQFGIVLVLIVVTHDMESEHPLAFRGESTKVAT